MTDTHDDAASRGDAEPTVLIATEDVLARWSSCATSSIDFLAFADTDAQQALHVIERRRPHVVVLEQLFAASTSGAALVNQLRSASDLAGLDIRILPAERSAVLGASGPLNGRSLTSLALPLRDGSTRRAPRIAMPSGAEVFVDGTRTALINVSAFGAQVLSTTILRPNQRVRIAINRNGGVSCTWAEVTWCAMELAQNTAAYRAGVKFAQAKPEFLEINSIRA